MIHFSTLSFGPFRLSKEQRLLLEGDTPLRLGSRAMDLLITLVDRAGKVVAKDELMAQVWPETTVEEANLKTQIAGLRRALGDGKGGQRYIDTQHGRGYSFVAAVSPAEESVAIRTAIARQHNLPAMLTRLVGQADNVPHLAEKRRQQRSLTIVGIGGVGKTSVASTVAESLLQHYEDGVEAGALARLSRQHAEYCREACRELATAWDTSSAGERRSNCQYLIEEVRGALEWAFSTSGDSDFGISLAIAAIPIWFELSLLDEARGNIERALRKMDESTDQLCRMQLQAALGASQLFSSRASGAERPPWAESPRRAGSLNESDQRLRTLWRLWLYRMFIGELPAALPVAEQFRLTSLNSGGRELAIANRLLGTTLHYLGDQAGSRHCLESMLNSYDKCASHLDINRFQSDQRVAARSVMARVLWLQGFPDQAVQTARVAVEIAQALDHSFSICLALAVAACPVLICIGDEAAAERAVTLLSDVSANGGLAIYQEWARDFEGIIKMRRGDLGVEGVRAVRDGLRRFPCALTYASFLSEVSESLGRLGLTGDGLKSIDDALEHAERTGETWCMPELLRIKADLMLREVTHSAMVAAESLFGQSLEWARRQGALAWELRTSISYARLLRDQGRAAEARNALANPYGRFREGFTTADLRHASKLLDALG